MTIRYTCRSCHQTLAEFPEDNEKVRFSLELLTPEDRMHIIKEDEEGNLNVQILCEYCQEAILHNPELSLLSSPLQ
jgi:redox-regulated HSP33 family molecular chaperone